MEECIVNNTLLHFSHRTKWFGFWFGYADNVAILEKGGAYCLPCIGRFIICLLHALNQNDVERQRRSDQLVEREAQD